MTEEVYTKDQTAQLVFNAEIKKDITAIMTSITTLDKNIANYAAQYMPRAEVQEWKSDADKFHDSMDKRVRFLERYAWAAIGIIGFVEVAAEAIGHIHFG